MRTPTLPPATHTNAVFLGRERVWLVDPGSPYAEARAALEEAIRGLEVPLAGIVLTHHHADHVGAVRWLRERHGLPVLAHPHTAARLAPTRLRGSALEPPLGRRRAVRPAMGRGAPRDAATPPRPAARLLAPPMGCDVAPPAPRSSNQAADSGLGAPPGEGGSGLVTAPLAEGDVLDGGGPEDRWRVLHTPGHAPGHVVLWQPARRGLVAGDMIAAVGTILVEPPDGDMARYLASLRRLRELSPAWLVPAHGGLVEPAGPVIQHYIDHRLARERAVLAATRGGARTLAEITAAAYPGLAPSLHPLASRSTHAHLLKLAAEGRVRCLGGVRDGADDGARDARWRASDEA